MARMRVSQAKLARAALNKALSGARRRRARGRIGAKSQPVHYFTRSQFASGVVTVVAGTDAFIASPFQLSNLADVTDFTNLYDMYKILKVKYTLMPRGNSSDVGILAGAGASTRVCSVLDYDDSLAPVSFNQLCQYSNIKWTSATQNHSRTIVPKFLREVSTGLGTTANEIATGWINCTNNNVYHRGIKLGIQAPSSGSAVYDLLVKYTLAFKGVR